MKVMKKSIMSALAILTLIVFAIISTRLVEASIGKNGRVQITKLPHPIIGLKKSATTTGSATSNTLPSQVTEIIHQKYGEIRNVFQVGDDWALTTLGNQNSSGVIGLYSCSPTDTACLSGQMPLSLPGWSFYKPPFAGGVTLLQIIGNTLIIDNGGHQTTFDVSTHSFGS